MAQKEDISAAQESSNETAITTTIPQRFPNIQSIGNSHGPVRKYPASTPLIMNKPGNNTAQPLPPNLYLLPKHLRHHHQHQQQQYKDSQPTTRPRRPNLLHQTNPPPCQHRQIDEGLARLEGYLEACRTGEVHLDVEVRLLRVGSMRRFRGLGEMEGPPI